MAHCPHCQAELPEDAASFCAACGRRVEGWKGVQRQGADEPLPGSQEPTRQMEPPPGLLRAAKKNGVSHAASKAAAASVATAAPSRKAPQAAGVVETDSAMMRAIKRNPVPSVIAFVVLAGGAAAGAFFLVRHLPRQSPPEARTTAPAPAMPASPTATATPPATAAAPGPAPAAKTAQKAPHKKAPQRMQPIAIPSKKQLASAKKPAEGRGGALPHKRVQTDSRSLDAKGAAPAAPAAEGASEAASGPAADTPKGDVPFVPKPPTDEELRHVAEDHFDADSVRQVVANKMPQVRACYERAFKFNSPGGKVEVAFTITGEGRTTNVHTESNSTGSDALAHCIEEHVKQWQFPHPLGGEVELIYPFVFAEGS